MNSLERFNNSILRKPFDRIPFALSMTKESLSNLKDYLEQDDEETIYYKMFDMDRRYTSPIYIGPAPRIYEDGT